MAQEASEMAGWPMPTHGEFVWSEIACSDIEKTQSFYENVFGWKFKKGDVGGIDYREFFTAGDSPAGGLYEISSEMFVDNAPPPHWMIYVAVDDVDANAELAQSLGATVHKVMDVPNVGRMAMMQDPTGAMIATFNPQV